MLSMIPYQVSPFDFIKTSLPTFSSFKQRTLLAFKTSTELSLQFTTQNFGFIFYSILFYTKNERTLHLECLRLTIQQSQYNRKTSCNKLLSNGAISISSGAILIIYKFYNCNYSNSKNYKIKSPYLYDIQTDHI